MWERERDVLDILERNEGSLGVNLMKMKRKWWRFNGSSTLHYKNLQAVPFFYDTHELCMSVLRDKKIELKRENMYRGRGSRKWFSEKVCLWINKICSCFAVSEWSSRFALWHEYFSRHFCTEWNAKVCDSQTEIMRSNLYARTEPPGFFV